MIMAETYESRATIKLKEEIFALGFPHEDCEKIASQGYLIRADLNTFFHTVWAFGEIERVRRRTLQELVEDREWFKKPFFERFTEYRPIESRVTPDTTPKLYRTLELNERLRKEILSMVIDEINSRNGSTT